MNILGISAFYHDSAACLVKDGEIIAAAQEERFTRKKHDAAFPKEAIEYCLEEAGIYTADLDYVGFYDKPFVKFERILETYLSIAPKGLKQFLSAMPIWLKEKLWTRSNIRSNLEYSGPILFSEHHESHAASAFYPSPFKDAIILTLDGVGEWATTTVAVGKGNNLEIKKEIHFPHSLGLLYSAFTYYIGFKVNSGEYKLMGLAPYGDPIYVDCIKKNLIDIRSDGSFRLNMEYFGYIEGDLMINEKFSSLFDGEARKPESTITHREMNMAASIQRIIEECVLNIAGYAKNLTEKKNIVLAGGVALEFNRPELKQISETLYNYEGGSKAIPELIALVFALGIYTSTFIAECVRAGVMGVSTGQKEAAASIGLTPNQTLRLVVMPQALRIIIPPTTNQYLNLTKNSSLAAAIAYPDIVLVFAGTALMQTGRAIEIISITMLSYLTLSITISILMNWYNKKMAIKEK